METRPPYQTDVSDEEWAFVAPYLTVLPQDAAQRKYPLREMFNGVRSIVKSGAHWRLMPPDLPPWPLVYQPMRRWMAAGCFEAIVQDLRILLRRAAERPAPPSARRHRRRRSWTRAPSSRRPRVAREPATMGTSDARARRSTSRSTRWAISWRC
jgi:transposase